MSTQTMRDECDDSLNILIVIVCYRVADLTINCLRSLAGQIHEVPRVHVIVCENGSGPELVAVLKNAILDNGWSDWITLQAISPNVGFTGGNNAALREAIDISPNSGFSCLPELRVPPSTGVLEATRRLDGAKWPKYVLLLNADTVMQPGSLLRLFDAAEGSPDAGIVGADLSGVDGTPQHSCFRDLSPISEFLRGAQTGILNRLFLRDAFFLEPPKGAAEFDWTSFACALIRSEVIRDIGLLDEGYFLYFDDADYCRTARNRGWKIRRCSHACVTHLEGQSNDVPSRTRSRQRRPRYYYVSRSRYFAKHCGTKGLWMANFAWSAGSLIDRLKSVILRRAPCACRREWIDIWTNACNPMLNSNASLVPQESRIVS